MRRSAPLIILACPSDRPRPKRIEQEPETSVHELRQCCNPALDGDDLVFQRSEESGSILPRETRMDSLFSGRLAQMPVQITHAERHADILLGEELAGRTDDGSPLLEAA